MLVKTYKDGGMWIFDGMIVQCLDCDWYMKATDKDDAEIQYRFHQIYHKCQPNKEVK